MYNSKLNPQNTKLKTPILVIGSGLAGLSFALKVAEFSKITLITKSEDIEQSNSFYAQGGIASVSYLPDSFEKHLQDTIVAGKGINKHKIVKKIILSAPKQIEKLIDWGTHFDKNADGNFNLSKEGGHSEKRILHHKDNTGAEIQTKLAKKVKEHHNITILLSHFAIDLITQHHIGEEVKRTKNDIKCYGSYVLDLQTKKIKTVLSKITFIATGGLGEIYKTSTNPTLATGDGIAMAYRAKAIIKDMEFIQFHPTSLYNPKESRPSFLITEALRGEGAVLRTMNGKKFMYKYDERKSLAPRDVVARAIDNEMKISGDNFVFLDATRIDKDILIRKFPNIYKKCKELDIDISKEFIPVIPAAHFVCGGIEVDENAKTWIENLYASGESIYSGMHGANRLASNSLLEAMVYSDIAANSIKQKIQNIKYKEHIPSWNDNGTSLPEEMILITQNKKELQEIMSNYVGIVRSNLRLKRALDRLAIIYEETEELYQKSKVSKKIIELRNLINIAYLIIKASQKREKSIGLHYSLD